MIIGADLFAFGEWGLGQHQNLQRHESHSVLPQSPRRIWTSDQRLAAGIHSRILIPSGSHQTSLLTIRQAEIDARSLHSLKLPANLRVSEKSLFYMKRDDSTDIVFTDESRTRIYFADASSGVPLVSLNFCSGFKKISDLHLAEINGATHRLVVADEGANEVQSFVIDLNRLNPCQSKQSRSIAQPLWIRSPNVLEGTSTSIFVGSKNRNSLNITRLKSDDMSVLTPTTLISNFASNSFGSVMVHPRTDELFVSIRRANLANHGGDFIQKWTADFSSHSSLQMCPSPDDLAFDFDVALPLIYVLCRQSQQVWVLDTDLNRRLSLDAGQSPKKLFVASDAQFRFVAILQSNEKIQLYRFPIDLNLFQQEMISSRLDLPGQIADMGALATLSEVILVSDQNHQIIFVDLEDQSIRDVYKLPRQMDEIVADGPSRVHFISQEVDSAFTWEQISSSIWGLTAFSIDEAPHHIERISERLYVTHKNSNRLAIINSTTGAKTFIALPHVGHRFALDASAQKLWILHADHVSLSEIDITPGSETPSANIALGFSPRHIVLNSTDNTLYVAGETNLRLLDATDLTNVIKTLSLPTRVDSMKVEATGVRVFTKGAFSSVFVDRASDSTRTQDKPADFFVGNASITAMASHAKNSLQSSASYTVLGGVDGLFASASNIIRWRLEDNELQFFPFGSSGQSWWPLRLSIKPDLVASDANDNVWILDSRRKAFQRVSPSFQPDAARNARVNWLTDFLAYPAKERLYSIFGMANLLVVTNFRTKTNTFYSICESPKQLILDSSNDRLFVLCSRSNGLIAFDLDEDADLLSMSFQGLAGIAEKMVHDPASSRLFVLRKHQSQLDVFSSGDLNLISTLSLAPGPSDLVFDSANQRIHIVSERSSLLTTINTVTLATSTLNHGLRALDRVVLGAGLHAFSQSLRNLYHESAGYTASSQLTAQAWPFEAAVSSGQQKVFVSYPEAKAIKILNEALLTNQDLDLGSAVKSLLVVDSENLLAACAPKTSEVLLVDSATHDVRARLSLPSECGPDQMRWMTLDLDRFLLVSCQRSDEIAVIDLSDNSLQMPLTMRLSEM